MKSKSNHSIRKKSFKKKIQNNQLRKVCQKDIRRKKKGKKKTYRIKNWSQYNNSLKQRGSITVWVSKEALAGWSAVPNGKPGAQPKYTDLAIQSTLRIGKVFGQRLRQTEGLVKSIFQMMGVDLDVPDYSTLSRRSGSLAVSLPKQDKRGEGLTILIDGSGLKIFGEGEWKVRKHGYSKHRTWRKIILGITPDGEIRMAALTKNNIDEADAAIDILGQEEGQIDTFGGDGAYDKRKIYQALLERGVKNIVVPPRRNAKIWQHGNCKSPPHPRDENLRQIRKSSRNKWAKDSNYHIRSLVETAMFRYKTIFGDKLNARKFKNQITEFMIAASSLNIMTHLGMPDSYALD